MGVQYSKCLRRRKVVHPKKLMIAAGDHAVDSSLPIPPALRDHWRARTYGILPEAGGMRDQYAGDIERMETAGAFYAAVSSWARVFYGSGDIAQWQRDHPNEWRITQQWMVLKENV